MQKVLRIMPALIIAAILLAFNPSRKEKVKWISFQELEKAYQKEQRPIIIDVYTNWCGWCKVMDRDTYGKDKVANYINSKYYAVKFNAESKDSVTLNNKTYHFDAANKVNELAVYLLYGRMGYPSTVILSAPGAQPAPLTGFLKPAELEPPLKYFGEGLHQKQNYPEFMRNFAGSW